MARRGAQWRSVLATGLAVMLLVAPEVVGFASSLVSPDGLQTDSLAVEVQRKEVMPFADGYKEVFYADIYGQKNTKWKEIYYDKNGVWKKEVIYDATGGEIVRLPEWTQEALQQKGLVNDLSPTEARKQEEAIYRLDDSVPNPMTGKNGDTDRVVTPQAIANPGGY